MSVDQQGDNDGFSGGDEDLCGDDDGQPGPSSEPWNGRVKMLTELDERCTAVPGGLSSPDRVRRCQWMLNFFLMSIATESSCER